MTEGPEHTVVGQFTICEIDDCKYVQLTIHAADGDTWVQRTPLCVHAMGEWVATLNTMKLCADMLMDRMKTHYNPFYISVEKT